MFEDAEPTGEDAYVPLHRFYKLVDFFFVALRNAELIHEVKEESPLVGCEHGFHIALYRAYVRSRLVYPLPESFLLRTGKGIVMVYLAPYFIKGREYLAFQHVRKGAFHRGERPSLDLPSFPLGLFLGLERLVHLGLQIGGGSFRSGYDAAEGFQEIVLVHFVRRLVELGAYPFEVGKPDGHDSLGRPVLVL